MKRFYHRHVLPRLVGTICGIDSVRRQRERVVPDARGVVLDIGTGNGHNLALLDPGKVERVIGLDPEPGMLERARPGFERFPAPVELLEAGAEEIPLRAASVDTVLLTYAACSIPEVDRALAEMRRVLRPSGRLLFAEHGLAPDPGVARWQHRLDGVWGVVAGGCHLDRDFPALLERAGFHAERLESFYVSGWPRLMGYHFVGSARR